MKNELKDTLKMAFNAPKPKNKQDFLRTIRTCEVTTPEMLLQQVRYIRVSVWIFALAVISFVIFGALKAFSETEELIPVIMPFVAAISVLENRRSKKYGMSELEMVTRFSLRSVLFARMIILGVAYLLMLAITSPIIAMTFGGETLVIALHMLIPYLVTMIISLQVERSILGRKLEYGSPAVAALISVFMTWIKNYDMSLVNSYGEIIRNWGILIVLVLTAVTVFEQWKTLECVEELA